jgi:putative GTP pyrophosphokinase
MLSNNQVKKIGKRLRSGDYSSSDIQFLDEYRRSFDEILVRTTSTLTRVNASLGQRAVIGGRSKRSKSIIRKLRRPENRGMALGRMADIVGVRAVVRGIDQQQALFDALIDKFEDLKIVDYRDSGQNYRAIHLIVKSQNRIIEIQIRTLEQQLWANESESFGEEVKEGGGAEMIQAYLTELSNICMKIEIDSSTMPSIFVSSRFDSRGVFDIYWPRLQRNFNNIPKDDLKSEKENSYIMIYDSKINQMSQMLEFAPEERSKATLEYQDICGNIDDDRFEALIINSPSKFAMRITHPRFFAEDI